MAIITKYKDGAERIHFPSTDKFICGTDEYYDDTTTYSTMTKIKAAGVTTQIGFGAATAVGNGRMVVGSHMDADNGISSGAAYIFDLDGNQLAKIKAFDGAAYDLFGTAVAVGNGRIVVGAYADDDLGNASGGAYIFDLDGNFLKKIKPTGGANEFFGWSVSVGSGRIVVGAYRNVDGKGQTTGAAYIFDLNGNLIKKIKPDDLMSLDNFGYSVAVGSGRIVVGAFGYNDTAPETWDNTYNGRIYIYDLDGIEIAKIAPPTPAPEGTSGVFTFYNYNGGAFGYSVDVGCNRIIVGSPYWDLMEPDDNTSTKEFNRGIVYTFDLDGNYLNTIEPYNRPSNKLLNGVNNEVVDTFFGYKVAVANGRFYVCSRMLSGLFWTAFDGVLYTYNLEGDGLWNYDPNTDYTQFGYSLCAGDGLVVVGSIQDGVVYDSTNFWNNNFANATGSVYVFDGQPKHPKFLDFIDKIEI